LSVVSQTLGRPSEGGAIRFAFSKHGPADPCVLVGDSHRRAVEPAPFPKLIDPFVVGAGLGRRRSYNRSRAMYGQTSQVLISPLRDAHQQLRDECLNTELLYTLREVQIIIERWRREYNTIRPHSSLGYRLPAPETILPADPACAIWKLQPDRPSLGTRLSFT
jgi:hypothetical protein